MSKKIVIVESDAASNQQIREWVEARGFVASQTEDGKTAVDLVRSEVPDLVVLSVELCAGQSGYIVCGKLKKDEELKKIPVIIVGRDAEGFESHKKLKARADDYLKKPFEPDALLEKIGALIGIPEPSEGAPPEAEGQATTREGDPDLDLLDEAFQSMAEDTELAGEELKIETAEEQVQAPPEEGLPEALETSEADQEALEQLAQSAGDAEEALEALQVEDKPAAEDEDDISLETLESVEELSPPAPDAPEHPSSLEPENVEVPRPALDGSKGKEYFALKEQNTRKDKEILRLKQEIHEREKEVVDLRERETQLEQQVSDLSADEARREAQLKAFGAERRKHEAALARAKEEARQLEAKLEAAQRELDQVREARADLQKQLETAQSDSGAAKSSLDALESETASLRARIAELEEASSKNEERAVKAYQKIKADERLLERAKKALTTAMQALEAPESGPAADEPFP
jgi:DNA-binding response OmpR family regulator